MADESQPTPVLKRAQLFEKKDKKRAVHVCAAVQEPALPVMANDLAAIMSARRSQVDASALGDEEYLDHQPVSVKHRPKRNAEQMQRAMEARREHIQAMEEAVKTDSTQEGIDADVALARGSELLNQKERAARAARAEAPEPQVYSASGPEKPPAPKSLLAGNRKNPECGPEAARSNTSAAKAASNTPVRSRVVGEGGGESELANAFAKRRAATQDKTLQVEPTCS